MHDIFVKLNSQFLDFNTNEESRGALAEASASLHLVSFSDRQCWQRN
ncbi:MAG: hypothetical protein QNJ37_12365 [Crocosphaera sp.]|nr:hypothetical protein [Crocosphaera sp.]